MSDFVELTDLTLAYGKTVAVESLNLSIRKGELIALLGPSGCGKTTTMRAITGLLRPASGKITLDGADITYVPANKRHVGLVFQSYALFPHLTVFENVAFGLRLKKLPTVAINQRVEAGLAMWRRDSGQTATAQSRFGDPQCRRIVVDDEDGPQRPPHAGVLEGLDEPLGAGRFGQELLDLVADRDSLVGDNGNHDRRYLAVRALGSYGREHLPAGHVGEEKI